MENEIFTFVTCGSAGYNLSQCCFTRKDADAYFEQLCKAAARDTLLVAYYCASAGGLVNASTEF